MNKKLITVLIILLLFALCLIAAAVCALVFMSYNTLGAVSAVNLVFSMNV